MKKNLRLILTNLFLNYLFLICMMINIQNNELRRRINFLFFETISLPISFIVSTSFITGSLTGSFLILGANEDSKRL